MYQILLNFLASIAASRQVFPLCLNGQPAGCVSSQLNREEDNITRAAHIAGAWICVELGNITPINVRSRDTFLSRLFFPVTAVLNKLQCSINPGAVLYFLKPNI